MPSLSSRLTTILAILFVLLSAAAARAETYIISSAPDWFPYKRGVAEWAVTGGKLAGKFGPQLYYSSKSYGVEGNLRGKDTLSLTLYGKTNHTLTLHRSEEKGGIVSWKGDGFVLFRMKSRSFSEAALAFTPPSCASPNGSLVLLPRPGDWNATIRKTLGRDSTRKLIRGIAFTDGCTECGGLEQRLLTWMKEHAKEAPTADMFFSAQHMYLDVPVGEELALVKELRREPWVRVLDLYPGECGGGISSNVTFPAKALAGIAPQADSVSGRVIQKALQELFKGRDFDIRLMEPEPGDGGRTNWATYRIITDSKFSRGEPGHWDTFELVVKPFDSVFASSDEVSLDISVKRLKSASKKGDALPRTLAGFERIADSAQKEVTIEERILVVLAVALEGRCDHMVEDTLNDVCVDAMKETMRFGQYGDSSAE